MLKSHAYVTRVKNQLFEKEEIELSEPLAQTAGRNYLHRRLPHG